MATNEQVIAWLTANPTATDAEITAAANASGVSAAQLAAVTGLPVADVSSRMEAAAPAAQTSAPVTSAPAANQGLAENATRAGGLLDQYKAYLKPAEYEQLIAPLMFTANENFGGKVQDYQVQLLTPLDTSKVGLPKQLEFTPAKTETRTGSDEGGEYTYQVEVPAQVKTTGVTPIGGDESSPITGYRSTTPVMVNGVPVFANYDATGKVTGYEGDNRVTTWTDGNNRLIGNWDASGKAAPISSASQTGLFNTGFHWADIRDNLEAAAVVAGNYILPGSSLVSSQLVTKGAQENLNTDVGRVANAAAGFAGGIDGNMANYGKVGEAVGLTGPTVTPTGAEGGAVSGTASGASPSVSAETMQLANATSDPLATLNALQGYTYADLNYLSGLQGMTPEILAQATANNALLTSIPREVIPSGSSTVTPVTTTTPPTSFLPGNLTVTDVVRALPLVPVVNQLVGDPLKLNPTVPTTQTGPTGFGIVPIPDTWKSPTYTGNTGGTTGGFTPVDLSKIFTDQNLLTGTQWQGLPNQQNLTFNDIFAAGQQSTPMGTPVNINNIVSAILGQTATSQKPA